MSTPTKPPLNAPSPAWKNMGLLAPAAHQYLLYNRSQIKIPGDHPRRSPQRRMIASRVRKSSGNIRRSRAVAFWVSALTHPAQDPAIGRNCSGVRRFSRQRRPARSSSASRGRQYKCVTSLAANRFDVIPVANSAGSGKAAAHHSDVLRRRRATA